MNYLGGKFKLLKQILPEFPQGIHNFLDLFAGGGNVGINISANKITLNDNNQNLYSIYSLFKRKGKKEIFDSIQEIITKFSLSESSKFGYDYYSCQSDTGLQEYNKVGYTKLREYFNSKKIKDDEYYLLLYVLIIYSFNNQLRFNNQGKFNLPVGKRDFNSKMKMKLSLFLDRIKSEKIMLSNYDFRDYP